VRLGELVAALGGLGLLVASFLPWYSAGGENATAWQAFSVVDLFIAAAAIAGLAVGMVVLFRLSVSYPIAGCAVATLFGAIALVLILNRLMNPPGEGLDLEFGAWLGLVCAAGITVGGYLGMQDAAAGRPASAS
jgi:Na+-transporting NADH:ubiquinone oxidoreductase subunit NqrB